MQSLREAIVEAEAKKIAIGHFNISDIAALKAIFDAGRECGLPIIIGASEGEREFLGTQQIAALIRSLREQYDFPIYLNADHVHSLESIKEAVNAGFDAVLFDGSKLPMEENILKTKEIVEYVKNTAPDILVEGELGYIGSGSTVLKEIPEGASVTSDLTEPLDAALFVKETGVHLFSPAVGTLHGMLADKSEPHLDIQRIKAIRQAAGVPLVLHGGSGTPEDDFVKAIDAGIAVLHISTELRVAWRKGIEETLRMHPEEVSPYKLLAGSYAAIREVTARRIRLFAKW
ncbi:class II fructose-bisphosphate aldolase [Candidatus Wolfebacteria bacterium]|nr:class II fructose-bisphosphate aldolase [Candidatus Wolfebacteria bacterium]